MKTQTPSHRSIRTVAALLVLSFGALLFLSGCHHGVYGQRYAHPHAAMHHRHAPNHYGPPRKPGQTWHRPIREDGNYISHHHTTWGDLHRQPSSRFRVVF